MATTIKIPEILKYIYVLKNLGRLWLAYTEFQGDFYMLQLMTDDSGHFTQPELSLWWSDLHEIKSVIFCITRSQ